MALIDSYMHMWGIFPSNLVGLSLEIEDMYWKNWYIGMGNERYCRMDIEKIRLYGKRASRRYQKAFKAIESRYNEVVPKDFVADDWEEIWPEEYAAHMISQSNHPDAMEFKGYIRNMPDMADYDNKVCELKKLFNELYPS